MTSLPIVKQALIPRVIGNMIAQCSAPTLSPRSFTPFRFDATNQARKDRRSPQQLRSEHINRDRTAPFTSAKTIGPMG
jgi:hypothetical protein